MEAPQSGAFLFVDILNQLSAKKFHEVDEARPSPNWFYVWTLKKGTKASLSAKRWKDEP